MKRGMKSSPVRIALLLMIILIGLIGFAYWLFSAPVNDELLATELPRLQLQSLAGVLLSIVAMGVLAGVSGMALVQWFKNLSYIRGKFHCKWVSNRFGPAWPDLLSLLSKVEAESRLKIDLGTSDLESSRFHEDLKAELKRLDAHALDTKFSPQAALDSLLVRWNCPAEQVVAQLGEVAEYVLVRPKSHVRTLQQFVGVNGEADLIRYLVGVIGGERDDGSFEVRHFVERELDSILLEMSHEWKRKMRGSSAGAAALVALGALSLVSATALVKAVVFAGSMILGGVFSWFFRDMFAVVEKWRS